MQKAFLRIPLLLLSYMSAMGVFQAQIIRLVNDFDHIEVDTATRFWASAHDAGATAKDAWQEMSRAELKELDQTHLGFKYHNERYDYWVRVILCNNTSRTQAIFMQTDHFLQGVFQIRNQYPEPIPYMGYQAVHDPNHLLLVKERRGFTKEVIAGSMDTFLLKIYSPTFNSPFNISLYEAKSYSTEQLRNAQWMTLINGIFFGTLLVCFFGSIYYYYRSRLTPVLWYAAYIFFFIIYFWRDFEFLNRDFEFTHGWLTWQATKFSQGLSIFVCYIYFIHGMIGSEKKNKWIKPLLLGTLWMTPVLILIDMALQKYYYPASNAFIYTIGTSMGLVQVRIIFPFLKRDRMDRSFMALLLGSAFLFFGWISLYLFKPSVHQIVIRICTLIEMICFLIAIIEKGMQQYVLNRQLQLSKSIALNEERFRISSELHDEIGSTLSGIHMYTYLAMDQFGPEQKNGLLNSIKLIKDSSGDLVTKLNEIVWFVKEDKVRFIKIIERLDDYARSIAFPKSILIKLNVSPQMDMVHMSLEAQKHIYLICKEAINNATKYSETKEIALSFVYINEKLSVQIKDTGKGFDADNIVPGNGLSNMEHRALLIGAELNIESKPGIGTAVHLMYKPLIIESWA